MCSQVGGLRPPKRILCAESPVAEGRWAMLELRDRVSDLQELPRFEIFDKKKNKRDIISPRLAELIKDRLERREQVILLVNRRGSAIKQVDESFLADL